VERYKSRFTHNNIWNNISILILKLKLLLYLL
jgi:hypothetical protein